MLEQRQQQLELDVQRRLDEERGRIAETVRTAEAERAGCARPSCRRSSTTRSHKLNETQRQLEQGSQQLQGEVLELILEEELAAAFPLDMRQRGQERRRAARTPASA